MTEDGTGLLPIGRFARATALTVKALRHYAEIDLLSPAYVDESTGYRYYAVTQLRDASAISRLRALGVPLSEVAQIVAADEDGVRAGLATHRERLATQAAETQAILDELDRLIGGEEELVPESVEIELRIEELPERTFVVRRDRQSMEELTAVIPRKIGETADWVFSNGGPAGPPMALVGWPDEEDDVDLDVGWRVAEPKSPPAPLESVTYPATRAILYEHWGPFENIARTYAALELALRKAALTPAGPAFELYETNPDEEPDPQKWLTLVVWPV